MSATLKSPEDSTGFFTILTDGCLVESCEGEAAMRSGETARGEQSEAESSAENRASASGSRGVARRQAGRAGRARRKPYSAGVCT